MRKIRKRSRIIVLKSNTSRLSANFHVETRKKIKEIKKYLLYVYIRKPVETS